MVIFDVTYWKFEQSSQTIIKTFNDLNEQIASSIKDPGIRVETSTQNFNGQIYHVIQGFESKKK